jgi:protein-S-isoprenylcysteine O-methyltransferase Ste14
VFAWADLQVVLWLIVLLYWILAARNAAKVRTEEGLGPGLADSAILLLSADLLFGSLLQKGPLDARFLPSSVWLGMTGTVITAVGLTFAILARRHLGSSWSAAVIIRVDHQLIRSGPYAWVRHPIYSGVLLAMLGTVLIMGSARALVAIALLLVGLLWKAHREDRILAREFGKEFDRYREQTSIAAATSNLGATAWQLLQHAALSVGKRADRRSTLNQRTWRHRGFAVTEPLPGIKRQTECRSH